MFRYLANQFTGGAVTGTMAANVILTAARPSVLAWYLERVWANRAGVAAPNLEVGVPAAGIAYHRGHARQIAFDIPIPAAARAVQLPPSWHHLVYAYMIEATNAMEVFRRVIFEYAHGERLPLPRQSVQWWARVTEELFFMTPSPYWVFGTTSDVRPDAGAVRKNAYYRLLGWELPAPGGRGGSFVKADAANREFTAVFEALLREVWRAYANRWNWSGENYTDVSATGLLVQRLRDMLNTRRYEGLLSREEFASVAIASWLHLTVSFDTLVVTNLGAQAQSAGERLRKIGERVGMPVHSRTDAFFRLARPMSVILRAIENGGISPAAPQVLWNAGPIRQRMLDIITNWPLTTGRPIKDGRATTVPTGMTPGPAFATNGAAAAAVPVGR